MWPPSLQPLAPVFVQHNPTGLTLVLFGLYLFTLMLAPQVLNRSLKQVTGTLKGFFLADKKLGGWAIAFSFVASWFGASSTKGSLDAYATEGLSALWLLALPSVVSVGLISGLMAARVAAQPHLSQPEAVEAHYGKASRGLLSVIILCSATTFVGSQLVAAGQVLHALTGVSIEVATWAVVGAILSYASLGGYFVVVMTDFLQMALMGLGLGLLLGWCLWQTAQHPEWVWHNWQTLATNGSGFWALSHHWGQDLALLASYSTAWVVSPEMWQRMSSASSPALAVKSAWRATAMLAALLLMVFIIGLLGAGLFPPQTTPAGDVLIRLAYHLPYEWLSALVMLAFLAAVTSSIDSCLNVGSLTFTQDLYHRFLRPQAPQKELVWVGRLATIGVSIPAVFVALKFQNILHILWLAADIYAAAMFVPVMGLLFLKNPGRLSGLLAMSFGLVSAIITGLHQYAGLNWAFWPPAPYSSLIGLSLSLLGFALGRWLDLALKPARAKVMHDNKPLDC